MYFRRQWFPELCEADLVPDFGTGRGLVRHPKETAEQFRARVVGAFRWHRLGGKTEGLPEILKFYGFDALTVENLRIFQPSRWAEFQLGLRTPATQAEQDALLADLDTLLWLVNEYKPARSVLARVYTDTYDRVPTVWSGGPISEQGWSNGFWSLFSGVTWPGDGGDIVVSFGMVRRFLSERYNETGAGLGVDRPARVEPFGLERRFSAQSRLHHRGNREPALVCADNQLVPVARGLGFPSLAGGGDMGPHFAGMEDALALMGQSGSRVFLAGRRQGTG